MIVGVDRVLVQDVVSEEMKGCVVLWNHIARSPTVLDDKKSIFDTVSTDWRFGMLSCRMGYCAWKVEPSTGPSRRRGRRWRRKP